MYSPHKHSYLQLRSSGINPRIINRAVNLARAKPTIDSGDFEPPLNRLTSEQPCIPCINVDLTRRPLAFGRLAIPKLCRELHSENLSVVLAAVTSFVDILHDPEKGYEAIKMGVPDRMINLLINDNAAIRERTCMALTVMADLADGKQAIAKSSKMLTNLSLLLDDVEDSVRIKAAACLERVSEFWVTADELIEFGFIPILLDCACKDREDIAAIQLQTLHCLMYEDEAIEQALQNDGFTTFCIIIEKGCDYLSSFSLKCLTRLLSIPNGKQLAYESNLLANLTRLLHDERPEVYGVAVSAIMFATIKSAAKVKAVNIERLPHRLVQLSYDMEYNLSQLHAIQALTNLCEHPEIRKVVSENYYNHLENLPVGDDEVVTNAKTKLMKIVNWVPQNG